MPDLPPDSPAPDLTTLPVARQEVRAQALRLLQDAGVQEPPTLVATLLAQCGIEYERFALTDLYSDRGQPIPLARARADLQPQVRGMVDVPSRMIYTHRVLGPTQERFCALHELGHFRLPWHNDLLKTCSELDLSPIARAAWEREANLFAAACLFQGERFARAADGSPFGLGTLQRLARHWAVSLEAAGREYVETRRIACAWVVARLRPDVALATEATAGEPLLEVRYAIGSRAWRARFGVEGHVPRGALLPWNHPATRLLLAGGFRTLRERTTLPQADGETLAVQAELASVGTDVLLLVRPAA
jgi:hypothetical protein